MADEDEPNDNVDFQDFIESFEERRRERREQVSYEWVETIRKAGELYRDTTNVDSTAEELDRSVDTTQEALAVYRLIFSNPPTNVAGAASAPGRAFFSLDDTVESVIDQDGDEPFEDLVREYVGAVYLENDIDAEPVGDPPKQSTPPLAVDFGEFAESLAGKTGFSTGVQQWSNEIAEVKRNIRKSQTRMVVDAVKPVISQRERLISDMVEPVIAQHEQFAQALVVAGLSPVVEQLRRQQEFVNAAAINATGTTGLPASILADLSLLHPLVRTAATTHGDSTETGQGSSVIAEAPFVHLNGRSLDDAGTTIPSSGPADATIDAVLPRSDAFTAELIFEIPAMLVDSVLSTGRARAWFNDLPPDYQITTVRLLLAATAFQLTGNLASAALAALLAPAVRQMILEQPE